MAVAGSRPPTPMNQARVPTELPISNDSVGPVKALKKLGWVAIVALIGIFIAVAYKRLDTGALEAFSTRFSCPKDRVVVRARDDVDAGLAVHPKRSPPAEIQADPARLAQFNADEDARRAKWRSSDNEAKVFEASGCGHDLLLVCFHTVRGGQTVDLSRVSCVDGAR